MEFLPNLFSLFGAIAGTALVGVSKKPIASLNATLRNVIKPVQPLVVLGLSVALPAIGSALGIGDMGPAEAWTNAPLSTLLAVSGREAYKRVATRTRGDR